MIIELTGGYISPGGRVNAIVFRLSEIENLRFSSWVDQGTLSYHELVQSIVSQSGDIIFWICDEAIGQAFLTIILNVGNNIIGYVVVEFIRFPTSAKHLPNVLASVLFPKIEGQFQDITEQYVQYSIASTIAKHKRAIV